MLSHLNKHLKRGFKTSAGAPVQRFVNSNPLSKLRCFERRVGLLSSLEPVSYGQLAIEKRPLDRLIASEHSSPCFLIQAHFDQTDELFIQGQTPLGIPPDG